MLLILGGLSEWEFRCNKKNEDIIIYGNGLKIPIFIFKSKRKMLKLQDSRKYQRKCFNNFIRSAKGKKNLLYQRSYQFMDLIQLLFEKRKINKKLWEFKWIDTKIIETN
ncbi:uncharacterized protein LOC135955187 [Calliphora vicina]|uniref:uncharacterized protein LOC135955187 n=1 Tax=Calliphora vicina TaxID=7373 RepID=UPI00325B7661